MSDPETLSILVVQMHARVGDIAARVDEIIAAMRRADAAGADVVVTPELSLTGYPPEDLVLKPAFLDAVEGALAAVLVASRACGVGVVLGAPLRSDHGITNSVLLVERGEILARHDKRELPNYGVFDEKRLFVAGQRPLEPVAFRGWRVGLAVCEDIWLDAVPQALKRAGAELLLVPNASPWRRTIGVERADAFGQWSATGLPYVFVNQAGGQDELVFDGASFAVDGVGTLTRILPDFETGERIVRFSAADGFSLDGPQATVSGGLEADYRAAMTGLRDYVEANRFPGVVLGLSGGIDSALVAAICADALGPQRVWCVMMPSRFTASQSRTDAEACAQALGVRYDTVAIGEGMAALDGMLGPLFAGTARGVAEENIQSRLRGMTLMALSNRFGPMVVSTGNKSELATGYATLYGDMAGGYNPLKDIWKTEVFALARWRNGHVPRGGKGPGGEVIPQAIIDRPPTAELREDQTDETALAPYPVLDGILRRLVDEDQSVADVIAAGFDANLVRRIEGLLYVAEYKRRQGAPGPKIGRKHFGRDRRYPITNAWRDRGKPTGD